MFERSYRRADIYRALLWDYRQPTQPLGFGKPLGSSGSGYTCLAERQVAAPETVLQGYDTTNNQGDIP